MQQNPTSLSAKKTPSERVRFSANARLEMVHLPSLEILWHRDDCHLQLLRNTQWLSGMIGTWTLREPSGCL